MTGRMRGPGRGLTSRRGQLPLLALACGAALLVAAAGAVLLRRSVLLQVVRVCALSDRVTGHPFPCLMVRDSGPAGYVVLRAPLRRSHIIVVPTAPIRGIESEAFREPGSGAYWREAWEARRFVTAKLPVNTSPVTIGMAVNSRPARSQDQVHIHVDCADSDVVAALTLHADEIGPAWRPLSFRLKHRPFWGRWVSDEDFSRINPVAEMMTGVEDARRDASQMTLGVIPASPTRGGFYLLARNSHGERQAAERLLDHSCWAAEAPLPPETKAGPAES